MSSAISLKSALAISNPVCVDTEKQTGRSLKQRLSPWTSGTAERVSPTERACTQRAPSSLGRLAGWHDPDAPDVTPSLEKKVLRLLPDTSTISAMAGHPSRTTAQINILYKTINDRSSNLRLVRGKRQSTQKPGSQPMPQQSEATCPHIPVTG